MFRMLIVAPLTALMLTACIVTPLDSGAGMVMAPALPLVVELGVEPYYSHAGYHYYYNNDRWSYSTSRSGPWSTLPRSHYPKETRFKRGDGDQSRGQNHERR